MLPIIQNIMLAYFVNPYNCHYEIATWNVFRKGREPSSSVSTVNLIEGIMLYMWVRNSSISLLPIVSAHRRILGMAPVVCVLVKICVSSISFYKLDTDKLTTPFESAHQFTLVCTVSDSKTVPGRHYNLCSNHSFVLTD